MRLRLYKFTLFYGVTWLLCTKSRGENLTPFASLLDATRPVESPLMGSRAGVTKHVSCSLMAPGFLNRIYFIFYRQTSVFFPVSSDQEIYYIVIRDMLDVIRGFLHGSGLQTQQIKWITTHL